MAEFKNPQQEPGIERNALVAIAVGFLLIMLAQPLLKKYFPQFAPATETSKPSTQPAAAPATENPASTASLTAPATTAASNAPATSKQASSEAETVIENNLYRITFSNRGAVVKSWILKKFDDDKGQPLNLVHPAAASEYGYPLSLWTYDESQRNKINSSLFVASPSDTSGTTKSLAFEYADQDLIVRKTFIFDDSYVIHAVTSVTSHGGNVTALPMWPAGLGDQATLASYAAALFDYQSNGNIERLAPKKISGGATLQPPLNWAGIVDQYFAAAFIPDDSQAANAVTLRNSLEVPKDPKKNSPQDLAKVELLGAAVGNPKGPTATRLYVGPKSLDVVESIKVPTISGAEPTLHGVVNFGFFGLIARPLFLWLRATYQFVRNWGWAIVIQTLIINLVLLPLRISSMKSALKMQKIQPQMNAIKDKYKKYALRDPRRQEMNTEIGTLMKDQGVSPVGGCLPMVIQMPFLFAYYSMLGAVLDLRHAHWLWVPDLSSPDPWHILPIFIIIAMFFTQRMTPQAGMDPQQQQMMNLMMPVMLGVISWNLAAGLGLYWAEGNLIALVQQTIMNRTGLGREMREMAIKRARKKDKDK